MIRLHRSPRTALQRASTWAAIGTLMIGSASIVDEPYRHWILFAGLACAVLGILLGEPTPPPGGEP